MTEIAQCSCGSKPRRRSATQGVFKFKYLRCPCCELQTDWFTKLSDDDEMIDEWNQLVRQPDPPEEGADDAK